MRAPKDHHPLTVAVMETMARQSGVEPGDLWAILAKKKVPPPDLLLAWLELFYPLLRPSDFLSPSLPAQGDISTLNSMSATATAEIRRGRPLAQRQHPFVAALLRENLTVIELARDMKRPASSVRSWYKHPKDRGWRPIPKDAATYLHKRLGVPTGAWHRIAD